MATSTSGMLAALHDWSAPLPVGRHTIEASAGTGKTFAIVGMATLYVAEGRCRADQLLVLSFSRSATRELRGRLLQRLAEAEALLSRHAGGLSPSPSDPVDARLLSGPAPDQLRRVRLALADIDHATITTIHSFADDLLRRIGDPELGELLDQERGLAAEILGDVYLRIGRKQPDLAGQLPYWSTTGLAVVSAGMRHPADALRPKPSMHDMVGARVFMAIAAGQEATRRKRAGRLHTYDDLLSRLEERLTAEDAGTSLTAVLRKRFTVGLVDEFQDTDPVQWNILSTLFDDPSGADGRSLVLVGDPKQAIYAFRGADITTYLAGRGDRPSATLGVNYRSDEPLVRACAALFDGISMGSGIVVHPMTAAFPSRITPQPPAPVAFRVVSDDAPVAVGKRGAPRVGSMREFVAADTANHVVTLLGCGWSLEADEGTVLPLAPHDIAVLVRTNAQAALVRQQLELRDVPVVLNGVGNVMGTSAAASWLAMLRALQQPWNGGSARIVALSDLIGWPMAEAAAADEPARDALHIDLHVLARVLVDEGVMAAFRWLDHHRAVSAKLRRQPGGSRRLADVEHVTEVLHAEQRRGAHGLGGLTTWLESAIAEAADPPPQHLARRLESDEDAVEIMTVHGAKGLQRGVVLAPFLWDAGVGDPDVLAYTDPATGTRVVDVGGNKPRRQDHGHIKQMAQQEREHEEMRLAYVAATRAKHHLVLWWASAGSSKDSSLAGLLFRGQAIAGTPAAGTAIRGLEDAHPGLFASDLITDPASVEVWQNDEDDPTPLTLATMDRSIDHGWQRSSYSRLVNTGTAAAMDDLVDGPAGEVLQDNAPEDEQPTADRLADVDLDLEGPLGTVVPLSGMPGGADVGTAIHGVLEHIDFGGPDRAEQIRAHLAAQSRGSSVDLTATEGVVEGLVAMLDTPLGPLAGGRALSGIPRTDRIDEMAFEMPVLGPAADQPDKLLLGDLADLLETHLDIDDLLRPYAAVLRRTLGTVEVRGFLAGYIDLIARVPDPAGGPDRYLVADYKTNRIAPPAAEHLRVGHFSRQAMAAEMLRHHYPIQAMFYAVATHRYLRWRITDYDPAVHLAGVAYLFLRGMTGLEAPVQEDGTPFGVFAWQPPAALLNALDDLLTSGRQ